MHPNGKGDVCVGVLAIQGDFQAHAEALVRAGATPILVRHPAEIAGVDGLILPGGESTTVLKFLTEERLFEPIREAAEKGVPIFGTCAGAILMAREVTNPEQRSLGLMDLRIRRNAYGRQASSFIVREPLCGASPDRRTEMVFIRAPIIEAAGPGVEILGRCRGTPVLVREGRLLASTFHPELAVESSIHSYFLRMARSARLDTGMS